MVAAAALAVAAPFTGASCSSESSKAAPARPGVEPPPYVPTPPVATVPAQPQTARRLRRLGNREMENVLADALGTRLLVTRGFLPDPRVDGYSNDVVALGISDSKVDEIATAAERAGSFVAAPANLQRLAPCPAGEAPDGCARTFAAWFTRRTWGRPADDGELGRLVEVYRSGSTLILDGEDPYAVGIGLATQAVIQSPHFVYRSELGEPPGTGPADGVPPGAVRLSGAEIASQLSFFLRGSRPDEPLLAAAAAGELADPAARERHARRLMASEATRRQMRYFFRAWLGLEHVSMLNKDLGIYMMFTPTMRRAMDKELETFLDHVLTHGGGRLDELMLADYSFPHPSLAPIYQDDLLDPAGDHTRVRLDPRRRGILSSPSFLASHALISQTNPVERGLVVRGRMFCQEVQAPPPDVVAETPGGVAGQTVRQRYEEHASNPRCRGCHLLMDPVGFGFEQFDSIGRYRTMEGDQPVDSRGQLHGTDVDGPFTGPAELAVRLIRSAQFRRCFVQQVWRFAEGRGAVSADAPDLDALAAAFETANHRLDELLVALVKRPTFVLRRATTEEPGP